MIRVEFIKAVLLLVIARNGAICCGNIYAFLSLLSIGHFLCLDAEKVTKEKSRRER